MEKVKILDYMRHLLNMAIADLNIASEELTLIYRLGIEKGLLEEDINELLNTPDLSLAKIPENLTTKLELLYDLCLVIWADDKLMNEERKLLEKMVVKCGFKKENKEEIAEYLLNQVREGLSFEQLLKEVEENINESKIT